MGRCRRRLASSDRPPGLHIIGVAVPDRCWVAISADLTGYKLCTTLVHEFGHLAGVGHSDDPASIMAPVMPMRDGPCIVQTFGALTIHRAAMAVRGRYQVSDRLRCRVVDNVVALCSERRRRRIREFIVEQTWTGYVDVRQLHVPGGLAAPVGDVGRREASPTGGSYEQR